MTLGQAKKALQDLGFEAVTGTMSIAFSNDHIVVEPVIGVLVSNTHRCFDGSCGTVHTIATETALMYMNELSLHRMIYQDLAANNR